MMVVVDLGLMPVILRVAVGLRMLLVVEGSAKSCATKP